MYELPPVLGCTHVNVTVVTTDTAIDVCVTTSVNFSNAQDCQHNSVLNTSRTEPQIGQ